MILGLVMYLLVEDTGNIHAQCLDIMKIDLDFVYIFSITYPESLVMILILSQ